MSRPISYLVGAVLALLVFGGSVVAFSVYDSPEASIQRAVAWGGGQP